MINKNQSFLNRSCCGTLKPLGSLSKLLCHLWIDDLLSSRSCESLLSLQQSVEKHWNFLWRNIILWFRCIGKAKYQTFWIIRCFIFHSHVIGGLYKAKYTFLLFLSARSYKYEHNKYDACEGRDQWNGNSTHFSSSTADAPVPFSAVTALTFPNRSSLAFFFASWSNQNACEENSSVWLIFSVRRKIK